MTPIQQLMLGVGAAKKTYMDDVFSTHLYIGNASDKTITNGIDLAGEGGLTWIKRRNAASDHALVDTERTASQYLSSNSSAANAATGADNNFNSFTSTGFTLKDDNGNDYFNKNNTPYSSWSFRKAPGFFDVVTYTGNPTSGGRQIAHSLGCVPGMIMIKCTSESKDWIVYQRGIGNGKALELNTTDAEATSSTYWSDTDPTSTHFTLGTSVTVNGDSKDYVAYLFAGGESTAATARSVEFDGSSDYLSLAPNSDLAFGTGDFTIEFWMKMVTKQYTIFFDMRPSPETTQGLYPCIYYNANSSSLRYSTNSGDQITGPDLEAGQWYHVALSRSGTSTKMFLNGTQVGSTYSDSHDYLNGDTTIGCRADTTTGDLDGYMSNVRCVKGTAVYTSSFRPPTEPLTNITNTKLLCCNDSSTTGSTVTPGTITATGTVTASTDSPFDDPAGFTFGDSKEGIVKCGSYVGSGSAGFEVYTGFEPQFVMIKNADTSSTDWLICDTMRGAWNASSGDTTNLLRPNLNSSESGTGAAFPTSTGFKTYHNYGYINTSGDKYIYMAIRRPDGYVGKPADAGTGVFAMDTGNSSSTIPTFDSGFPVDFAFQREPASSQGWYTSARLIATKYLRLDTTNSEANESTDTFDSNAGWNKAGYNSSAQSWMWKRHAGFDVVTYTGNSSGTGSSQVISHQMNAVPEMIWIKDRDDTINWVAGHKGLNGGTNPWNYHLKLNTNDAEATGSGAWFDTAPSSSNFTIGHYGNWNANNHNYIAMLFSSISGISAVGSYTGTGSSLDITTGFQPRFLIIKRVDGSAGWFVLDTTRGWGSGNDNFLLLNDTADQEGSYNIGEPSSNGFQLNGSDNNYNANGLKYIYYAHA